jgi:predicted aspartyl protease
MTKVSIYKLEQQDLLLYVRGAVGASDGQTKVVRLLIDTGARRTVLPFRLLKKFGLNVDHPANTIRVTAAGGVLQVPICPVPWLNCLGTRLENFAVLALDLPPSAEIDGLLGMDFLTQVGAIVDVEKAEIRLKSTELT